MTKPDWDAKPIPNVPKDDLLAQLLMQFPRLIYKYHEHDSLLENKGEEELSEQEKNDAWALYEADVKRKNETNFGPYNNSFGMYPNYSGLGTYANSLFNNYGNLSGVSGLNYPYNMYGQYPYGNDYNQILFNLRIKLRQFGHAVVSIDLLLVHYTAAHRLFRDGTRVNGFFHCAQRYQSIDVAHLLLSQSEYAENVLLCQKNRRMFNIESKISPHENQLSKKMCLNIYDRSMDSMMCRAK